MPVRACADQSLLAPLMLAPPLVIRLVIAMALMPDASYCEVLARLAGLIADIPFALDWHVPTEEVVPDWQPAVGPWPGS